MISIINCSAGVLLAGYHNADGQDIQPPPNREQLQQLSTDFIKVLLSDEIYWAVTVTPTAAHAFAFDGWDWACASIAYGDTDPRAVALEALREACDEASVLAESEFWETATTEITRIVGEPAPLLVV